MLIDNIDHVQLALPPGGEPAAVAFYEGVLGIPNVPKPPELAKRGGCWFERGSLRVHLGAQDDFVAATKAHPAFAVLDLDAMERILADAAVRHERVDGPEGPQVYAWDPFGNRLEFRPERLTAPRADNADVIVDAVRSADESHAQSLDFWLEIDRLRSVQRRSFIMGSERRENTAEHSWHVALGALVFADAAPDGVSIGRVMQMLLLHDIVEIDAGDVSVHDAVGNVDKQAREAAAADRLFALLPVDTGTTLRALWNEYESAATPDALFAHSIDRLAPVLFNVASGGFAWRREGITIDMVRRVCATIPAGAPALGPLVDRVIAAAIDNGFIDG